MMQLSWPIMAFRQPFLSRKISLPLWFMMFTIICHCQWHNDAASCCKCVAWYHQNSCLLSTDICGHLQSFLTLQVILFTSDRSKLNQRRNLFLSNNQFYRVPENEIKYTRQKNKIIQYFYQKKEIIRQYGILKY